MPITIRTNEKVRVAHEFTSKPGQAAVEFTEAWPCAVAASGSNESGVAMFEPCDGSNNDGYIGVALVPTPERSGVGAVRDTVISGLSGVLPAVDVFLDQNGWFTQAQADVVTAPDDTVVPTEGAAGALGAGVYKLAAAFVDEDGGVGLATAPVSVTIAASKQIDVADFEQPLPDGVSAVRWYMSVAAGSNTLRQIVENDGTAFSINALPAGDAAVPETSVAVRGSRRIGIGFTATMIALD